MPGVDFFLWCLDAVASRYGWTKTYCEESLYWEEFWQIVQMTSNFSADEKNADLKFQFLLHADKKSAGKWKDLPIPFPIETGTDGIKGDKGGVNQLPQNLKNLVYKG